MNSYNPPGDSDVGVSSFTGTYAVFAVIGDEPSSAALAGQRSGCVTQTSDDRDFFYHVLLPRQVSSETPL